MRVALAIWKNRISPLFDATSRLLILHIQKKEILASHIEVLECPSIFLWAQKLDELRIQVLICGGLSAFSEYLIQARGIPAKVVARDEDVAVVKGVAPVKVAELVRVAVVVPVKAVESRDEMSNEVSIDTLNHILLF
jgi:predicted Fe-Mo cluster-binding NifX family protein